MEQIEELIKSYNNDLDGEEIIIKQKLKMVNELIEPCKRTQDEAILNEIIENLVEIIAMQKDDLDWKLYEEAVACGYGPDTTAFMTAIPRGEGFTDDKQLKNCFKEFLLQQGKSKHTINDYFSRLRKVWKSFYDEYQSGCLDNVQLSDDTIVLNNPLLNAYNNTDELLRYVENKRLYSDDKKNWANVRAALNRLVIFKQGN